MAGTLLQLAEWWSEGVTLGDGVPEVPTDDDRKGISLPDYDMIRIAIAILKNYKAAEVVGLPAKLFKQGTCTR